MNAALKAEGTSLDEIEEKIETAKSQFSDAGIDVIEKEGLLFISLPEKLLFKEGRTMNRRIQIILNPGLNRLLDMLE